MARNLRKIYADLAKYFGLRSKDAFLNPLQENKYTSASQRESTSRDLFLQEIYGEASKLYASRPELVKIAKGLNPNDFCVTSYSESEANDFAAIDHVRVQDQGSGAADPPAIQEIDRQIKKIDRILNARARAAASKKNKKEEEAKTQDELVDALAQEIKDINDKYDRSARLIQQYRDQNFNTRIFQGSQDHLNNLIHKQEIEQLKKNVTYGDEKLAAEIALASPDVATGPTYMSSSFKSAKGVIKGKTTLEQQLNTSLTQTAGERPLTPEDFQVTESGTREIGPATELNVYENDAGLKLKKGDLINTGSGMFAGRVIKTFTRNGKKYATVEDSVELKPGQRYAEIDVPTFREEGPRTIKKEVIVEDYRETRSALGGKPAPLRASLEELARRPYRIPSAGNHIRNSEGNIIAINQEEIAGGSEYNIYQQQLNAKNKEIKAAKLRASERIKQVNQLKKQSEELTPVVEQFKAEVAADEAAAQAAQNTPAKKRQRRSLRGRKKQLLQQRQLLAARYGPNRYYLNQFLGEIKNNVTAIQVFPADTGLDIVDADVSSLFLNSIRTLTMSQAVPYMQINVFRETKIQSSTGNLSGDINASLGKFMGLGGAATEGIQDPLLAVFVPNDEQEIIRKSYDVNQISSMEVFTMPQTAIGYGDTNYSRVNAGPVDIFRPFLGVNSLTLNDSPTGAGADSYKTGELKLTLYDKGRMRDIAEFVSPRRYTDIKFEITWGWSHPAGSRIGRRSDANVDDRLGEFINSMKTTEVFQMISSQYTVNEDGTIDITMKLNTKAMVDLRNKDIISLSVNQNMAVDIGSQGSMTLLELQNQLEDISKTLREQSKFQHKEIKLPVFIQNPDAESLISLDRKSIKEIRKLAATLKQTKNPNLKSIAAQLMVIFAKKGNPVKEQLIKSRKGSIDDIIEHLANTPDPYLRANPRVIGGKGFLNSSKYVSYGKLMTYVFNNAYANEANVDLQLVFSSFNRNAGGVYAFNIAQFPIQIDGAKNERTLKKVLYTRLSRNPKVSLQEFVRTIKDNFLDFYGSEAYGLTQRGVKVSEQKRSSNYLANQRVFKFSANAQKRLNSIYGNGNRIKPSFTQPSVNCRITSKVSKDGRTIIRVNFVDTVAGSFASTAEMLQSLMGKGRVYEENFSDDDPYVRDPRHNEVYNKNLQKLIDAGVIGVISEDQKNQIKEAITEAVNNSGTNVDVHELQKSVIERMEKIYVLKGGSGKIRQFLFSNSPYLLHGTEGSGIMQANISTETDDKLVSARLSEQFSKKATAVRPERREDLPFETWLANIDLKVLGCPSIKYSQKYFLDFATDTSLDNYYYVNGVNHEINASTYELQLQMRPQDIWGVYSNSLNQIESILLDAALADTNKIVAAEKAKIRRALKTRRARRRSRAARLEEKLLRSRIAQNMEQSWKLPELGDN